MANDYLPGRDGDSHAWQDNFACCLTGGTPIPPLADLGLVAGDVAEVNAAQGVWTTAYPAHTAAQTAAPSARQSKDDARGGLEGAVRPMVRRLEASP